MRRLFYVLTLPCLITFAATAIHAQGLLDPKTQPQFVNPLPIPAVIDARNGGAFTIAVTQFEQNLGLIDPVTKQPLLTKVWGYNGTYPGPTILARKGRPIDIRWENKLIDNKGPLPHLLSIDPTVEWALTGRSDWQKLGVPIITHVHGGHTEAASDGLPLAWFTPNFALKGSGFVKPTLHYANDQEAATIWYHDHAMGITRLNVYAGLAGYYLITDANEMRLQAAHQLPVSPYDIGLAIQDRMFTGSGQLTYTTMPEASGVPEESIMPEFFGNVILVNGKAWPVLEVEPRPYRFRILNGSDSRFYNLTLSSGQPFIQIGTDDGLLPAPVTLSKLLIGTGERRDVVIDFSDPALRGQTIIVHNNAKTPYPKGTPVDPRTTGRIMAFKVTRPLDTRYPVTTLPATLRPPIVALQSNLPPRKLIMFEGTDEFDRLKVMLGTVDKGVMDFDDPITEKIMQNSTEIWEIYNETPDAHTIHLHLVHMQLINRQKFSASIDMESGKPSNIRLQGAAKAPTADEAGWKDTYIMYPGEVTRVIATFDLAGVYVWHCHILSHEDHEMMRPYLVQAAPNTQALFKQTIAKDDAANPFDLQTLPNPFNTTLGIQFRLQKESAVVINVYDSKGGLVKQVYSGKRNAGIHQFGIDGTNMSNGIYFCDVSIDGVHMQRKLVLQK